MTPYYQDDWCTIYNSDCRDVLPFLPRVDLVLTDPPYGIGEARGKNKSRSVLAVSKDYGTATWDDAPPSEQTLLLIRGHSRYQIIFGGNYFQLPPSSCWLVWDKLNGENDFADCELAWTNLDRAVRRIRWQWHGMFREGNEPRYHPTQKPLGVLKWALSLAPDDCELILDPFMGSGTTLVAAKQMGRRAIGIEIERKYVEIAVERLRQEPLPFIANPDPELQQASLLLQE